MQLDIFLKPVSHILLAIRENSGSSHFCIGFTFMPWSNIHIFIESLAHTVNSINAIGWSHYLPVCLTWAGKWRGWWWRAGKGSCRGREWWSLPLCLIGQLDRSASKAWLRHPLVCLGCKRDAVETEIERKIGGKKDKSLTVGCIRLDICNMARLSPRTEIDQRKITWWLRDKVSHAGQLVLLSLYCVTLLTF